MSGAQPGHRGGVGEAIGDALAVVRYPIVLVAMAAAVVFGWLMRGERPWVLALVVGLDWFLVNLLNRVTDIAEDLRNGIRGTERLARRKRWVVLGAWALLLGSFPLTHAVWPALTPWRLGVQLIGMAYNYRLVPTPRGLRRFKEIYFFKNFISAVLFVLTCFAYPLVAGPGERAMPWSSIAALALFFVPFELTYEVLYDLRDLDGDRAEGVPTYPVVHGVRASLRIVDALLAGAGTVLVVGLASGLLGLREGLMLAAPAAQRIFYRSRLRADRLDGGGAALTSADCTALTHLGTALLLFYLAGTAVWSALGLPDNVFLTGR
jgi:4-hydroxybenzoate polyprenyltransferase